MFLAAFFTTGRIIFMLFFIIAFAALAVYSYRKDLKNHKIHYKNAAKKLAIYGLLVVAVFIAFRLLTGQ